MYKAILIESKEYSDIQLGMNGVLYLENGESIVLKKYQHIILIDLGAKHTNGDWVFLNQRNIIEYCCNFPLKGMIFSNPGVDKLISSTNKAHTVDLGHLCLDVLPQLSDKSKSLLVDYYNKHGEMPESVDVEMKYIYPIESGIPNTSREPDLEIKLNQQGEVDITIPKNKLSL